jgi:hypothetical protein
VKFAGASGLREWTGRIVVDHEKFLRYRQTVVETADQVELEISLTAESDLVLRLHILGIDFMMHHFHFQHRGESGHVEQHVESEDIDAGAHRDGLRDGRAGR